MTQGKSVPTNREVVELKYCEDKTGLWQPLNFALALQLATEGGVEATKGYQKFIARPGKGGELYWV
jgi:hypothetical protein